MPLITTANTQNLGTSCHKRPSTAPVGLLSNPHLTGLAVQSLCELVDCGGNLQPLVKDGSLTLEADVAGPFHKAGEIAFGLDVLTWLTEAENKEPLINHFTQMQQCLDSAVKSIKCISDLGGRLSAILLRKQ